MPGGAGEVLRASS